jgi:hypothetical protein
MAEIITEHLGVCIVSIAFPRPPTGLGGFPDTVQLICLRRPIILSLRRLSAARSRNCIVALIAVQLALKVLDPLVDGILGFHKPLLDVFTYHGKIICDASIPHGLVAFFEVARG